MATHPWGDKRDAAQVQETALTVARGVVEACAEEERIHIVGVDAESERQIGQGILTVKVQAGAASQQHRLSYRVSAHLRRALRRAPACASAAPVSAG